MIRLAVLLVMLLAGCSSSDPTLYTLGRRPGTVRPMPGQFVAVRDVTIPRYLERQGLVRRDGERLIVAENDWWGETMAAMVRRVLAADLAQRLPGADVLASDGIGGERPAAEVELDVQRFEPDGHGAVVLEAVAMVSGRERPRTLEKLAVQVGYTGTAARTQVEAMSDALAQAADAIAARLAR